jgi:hypothetical protein
MDLDGASELVYFDFGGLQARIEYISVLFRDYRAIDQI